MSLDDKFYSRRTDPLSQWDTLLVRTAGAIATATRNITGWEYETVKRAAKHTTTVLWTLAAAGLFHHEALGFVVPSYLAYRSHDSRVIGQITPLQEELLYGSMRMWRSTDKFKRLLTLGGAGMLYCLAGEVPDPAVKVAAAAAGTAVLSRCLEFYLALAEPPPGPRLVPK